MLRRFVPLFLVAVMVPSAAAAAPADIAQLLGAAVARCWNPPSGAVGSVVVHVELSRDGHVVGTPIANGLANAGVAKAAVRAVEFCQPYHLPTERFSDWQHASVRLTAGTGR